MFSDILTRVHWKPLELEDRYPLYAMTKDLERTIKMADRSYKGPFVALSLCVASRTRTRFFVIFLAASIVFGISVSANYTQYLVFCMIKMSKSRFFLSRSYIGQDLRFSSKIGAILTKLGWFDNLLREIKLIRPNAECKLLVHRPYEQSFFFRGPSSKTPETHKWQRALVHCSRSRALSIPSLSQPLANLFVTVHVPVMYYFAFFLKCQELQLLN